MSGQSGRLIEDISNLCGETYQHEDGVTYGPRRRCTIVMPRIGPTRIKILRQQPSVWEIEVATPRPPPPAGGKGMGIFVICGEFMNDLFSTLSLQLHVNSSNKTKAKTGASCKIIKGYEGNRAKDPFCSLPTISHLVAPQLDSHISRMRREVCSAVASGLAATSSIFGWHEHGRVGEIMQVKHAQPLSRVAIIRQMRSDIEQKKTPLDGGR
jgi:hypothetical protein